MTFRMFTGAVLGCKQALAAALMVVMLPSQATLPGSVRSSEPSSVHQEFLHLPPIVLDRVQEMERKFWERNSDLGLAIVLDAEEETGLNSSARLKVLRTFVYELEVVLEAAALEYEKWILDARSHHGESLWEFLVDRRGEYFITALGLIVLAAKFLTGSLRKELRKTEGPGVLTGSAFLVTMVGIALVFDHSARYFDFQNDVNSIPSWKWDLSRVRNFQAYVQSSGDQVQKELLRAISELESSSR